MIHLIQFYANNVSKDMIKKLKQIKYHVFLSLKIAKL